MLLKNNFKARLKHFKDLHGNCSAYLIDKAAEWNSILEKLTGELSSYR